MHIKGLLGAAALLLPGVASATTTYLVTLTPSNDSGVTGTVTFKLDGNTLSYDIEASGLSDLGRHYAEIHGLDLAPNGAVVSTPTGVPTDTPPPTPAADTNHNGLVTDNEAVVAIGGVILGLAPHQPGEDAGALGFYSTNGVLSAKGSFDLAQDYYQPGYSEKDILPLDLRTFDLHGTVVPTSTLFQDGAENLVGQFDATLPAAGGTINLVGSAVAEPASWAMMIAGFGLVGASLRKRPRVAVRFG